MPYHAQWSVPGDVILDAIRFSSKPEPIREAAFLTIDAVQKFPPGIQIEGIFAAAAILARTLNLDAHAMMARARRQLPDLEAVESSASAISDYAKGELM